MSKGTVWHVAENFRHEDSFKHASKIVQQGAIGQLVCCRLVFNEGMHQGVPYYNTEWRKDPEYPGGFLFDGGVHYVATLRLILGREFTRAFAFGR